MWLIVIFIGVGTALVTALVGPSAAGLIEAERNNNSASRRNSFRHLLVMAMAVPIFISSFFVMKQLRAKKYDLEMDNAEANRAFVQRYLVEHDERLYGRDPAEVRFDVDDVAVTVTCGDIRFVVDDAVSYEYLRAYDAQYSNFDYTAKVNNDHLLAAAGLASIVTVAVCLLSYIPDPIRRRYECVVRKLAQAR